MARFAGVKLTSQEAFIYCHFRQITRNKSAKSSSSELEVYQLYDQELMAQVFLLVENLGAHTKFTAAYPNIFE
jgi:hypothetical protein